MKNIKVEVLKQGSVVVNPQCYIRSCHEDIIAFYLDTYVDDTRIGDSGYVDFVSATYNDNIGGKTDVPVIVLSDGNDESVDTEICFPEFEGFHVFGADGIGIVRVCLVKHRSSEPNS